MKWDGPLSVNTAAYGDDTFGSSGEQRIAAVSFAGKDYLLFTVKNNTGVAANLFFLTFKSQNGAAGYTLKLAEGGKYDVMAAGETAWTEKTASKVHVEGAGPMIALQVPAGESVVRVPLDSTTLSGAAAGMSNASAENDQFTLKQIDTLEVYASAPGAGSDKTVSLVKFAVADKAQEPPAPVGPAYAETDKIQLNPGEKAYILTGFEEGDGMDFAGANTQRNAAIVSEGANNGSKALKFTFVDGSQNGFTTFTLNTGSKSDWSNAKYIQFYIKNDTRCDNPLQLFYVKFSGHMLDYPATGVMLYNMKTGKWTETTMQPNFAHYNPNREGDFGSDPDTGIFYIPSINLVSGFEGYVRIPLQDSNFDSALDLAHMSNIELYAIVEGVAGNAAAYIDDYALVTYEGDQAPAYVDGKPQQEPDPTPGGDDELEATFSLSGKIVDANGNALANATVTLANNSTADKRTFVTDGNGQFRFDGVKSGWAELTVVGADGTDYGYITYNFTAVNGETSAVGTNVNVNVHATGLILQIGMDVLGLDPTGVTEGVLDVTPGTPADSGTDTGDSSNVKTGEVSSVLPALAVCLLAIAAVVIAAKRKKA